MSNERERISDSSPQFLWQIPFPSIDRRGRVGDIQGTLFLDVDGTLTRPGSMYAVDTEAIKVLAEFTNRGGKCIFNTGAIVGRLERTVFTQLFNALDEKNSMPTAIKIFQDHIIAMPENGSAVLLNAGVEVVENELYYKWHTLHPLHVPDKRLLRGVIETELVPQYRNSMVIGDQPGDLNPRQYILSWKGLSHTLELVQMIKQEVIPKHPEIHWQDIALKAARTTIDFVHASSGKRFSSGWILREFGSLQGPVLGFGDLGDEFAEVVPTINVNQLRPNEFRRRGMPAMELTRWELLNKNDFIITGQRENAKVRDKQTDTEKHVLRDERGEIIYGKKSDHGYLVSTSENEGYPIEIKPSTYKDNGQTKPVEDAGKGTAWMIRRLMEIGYFSL